MIGGRVAGTPAASIGALLQPFTTRGGKAEKAGDTLAYAGNVPMLIDEGYANSRIISSMKKAKVSPKTLSRAKLVAAQSMGGYLGMAATPMVMN